MKQYVHPILGLIANKNGKNYFISWDDGRFRIDQPLSEKRLLALWFIEKEEEPDTKWIDDARNEYRSVIGLWDESDFSKLCKGYISM